MIRLFTFSTFLITLLATSGAFCQTSLSGNISSTLDEACSPHQVNGDIYDTDNWSPSCSPPSINNGTFDISGINLPTEDYLGTDCFSASGNYNTQLNHKGALVSNQFTRRK